MDEGYFLYFEDIDFCRRARLAGFQSLYWPEAHVVHLRGGSGPVKEQQAKRRPLPAYFYASRSRFFAKSYGRAGLLAANVMWVLGRSISLLREVVSRKKRHLCEKEGRGLWHNFLHPVAPPESWRGDFPPKA
jgi:GT2 family glycosyltransferase